MPRRRTRVYWRGRGSEHRAYADFRDFADVGGRREALIWPGETRATIDPDRADKLVADRLRQLEELQKKLMSEPGVKLLRRL